MAKKNTKSRYWVDDNSILPEIVITPQGNYPVLDEAGNPARTVGAIQDINPNAHIYERVNTQPFMDDYIKGETNTAANQRADALDAQVVPHMGDFVSAAAKPLDALMPSRWVGLLDKDYDGLSAVDRFSRLFDENNKGLFINDNPYGLFSKQYAEEHPYWAMAGNAAFDIASTPIIINGAKEVYNVGKTAAKNVPNAMQFLNSPYTGKWTRFGNREYRFKPGYVGMNGTPIESRIPKTIEENANIIDVEYPFNVVRTSEEMPQIVRFQGRSSIPYDMTANADYFIKQNLTKYDPVTKTMVSRGYKKIDEIPNLRETINNITSTITEDQIRKEFLDSNYINGFIESASRQGIDVSDLSTTDIAKILTEQYNQLSSTSSGLLKDNVLWRTWGRTLPQEYFDWQSHIGDFTGNRGFWGEGNYFGTGRFGTGTGSPNVPYMINGIEEIGYDNLLGATDAAGDVIRNGGNAGGELATQWMSESPSTRMVAATPNGMRNKYGWLDTGEPGIEVVTQKNTGIKALYPDLTIGNGTTFPRSWKDENTMRSIFPWLLGTGTAATAYGASQQDSNVKAYGGLLDMANKFKDGGSKNDYNTWKKKIKDYKGIIVDGDDTYDYYNFFKDNPQMAWDMLNDNPEAHFIDKYKTPNHPTYSNESIYSKTPYIQGGTWNDYSPTVMGQKWNYALSPSQVNSNWDVERTINYLADAENEGAYVTDSNGRYPIVDGTVLGGTLIPVTITPNSYSQGGHLRPKVWNDLTIKEKAEMMKVAIDEGITDLKEIRNRYNEYAESFV